ncbi:hypothetical protein C2845_PM06G18020 [Panicum miliaceum]|uniref:Bifunctional inhibitor/plant lipid transfer protein/seed storage helical domain-containing protein n=1 Tax=Panicum miliaceum TaxID=4540 RepID=A0A3L6R9N4_PANMI|nr:hypothetical protein C2845_PM06G18020 [Panicum miliaceum]
MAAAHHQQRPRAAAALLLVAVAALLLASAPPSGAQPLPSPAAAAPGPLGSGGIDPACMTSLLNMSDCLTYVTKGSTARRPDAPCCPELAGLVGSNPVCLCELLSGAADSYGIAVDYDRALALPGICRVATPPVSTCTGSPRSVHLPPFPVDAADCGGGFDLCVRALINRGSLMRIAAMGYHVHVGPAAAPMSGSPSPMSGMAPSGEGPVFPGTSPVASPPSSTSHAARRSSSAGGIHLAALAMLPLATAAAVSGML